ncbi:Hypothetical predicted protein [Octopus vulgaris]|uniref:Uncharacterized protein n=1 Tax=Octopus vulgaris TaxID=6645 RepID=A0AA36BYR7_OCTVU|nr:Hypothetical predicted protein [Octopus vulgaris]
MPQEFYTLLNYFEGPFSCQISDGNYVTAISVKISVSQRKHIHTEEHLYHRDICRSLKTQKPIHTGKKYPSV